MMKFTKRRVLATTVLSLALVAGDCDDDDDDCGECFFFLPPSHGPVADLNRDGFADLVIGAPLHDGGGTERGAVFVHFGSASGPSPTPGITIFGAEDGAHFGSALSLAGDVNGQGAPDLLVGAPLDDADGNATDEGADRGRAFVYFGGPAMDAVADIVIDGTEDGAQLGASVAGIDDTNQDGFDDWIVGAPTDDGDGNTTDEGSDRGRAFFFYGRLTASAVADLTFTGTELGAEFGSVVAPAGDLNAGGAEDLAVGAPFDDGDGNAIDGGADRGRVFVFFGGVALDTTPDVTLTGDQNDAQFGAAVAPVFDVSGDGIDDLLVGAPLHDAGGSAGANRGRAYVYFGGLTPDANADLTLSGTTTGGAFGSAVSRAGDVDGDGSLDLLVGAPLENPGGRADAGSAYLFLGGPLDPVFDLAFDGAEVGAQFGAAVAGPGDFNRNGRDFVIGAPLDDADGNASNNGLDAGSAFVFFGGPTALDDVPDSVIDGPQDGAHAGAALGN